MKVEYAVKAMDASVGSEENRNSTKTEMGNENVLWDSKASNLIMIEDSV